MLESNKKEDNIFTLVIIYFVIAVVITALAVFFHKINGIGIIDYFSKENKSENTINNEIASLKNEEKSTDNIKRISLSDTFKKNNIKIEEGNLEYGEEVYEESAYPIRKIRIIYPQISGLKDKNIENKINQKIKEKCENLVSYEESIDDEIESIMVSTWIAGNFSNTLSVNINKYIVYKNEEINGDDYYDAINFKLDTGEEISFEEMFTPDVSFKNMITQSAYNLMSKKVKEEYYDLVENLESEKTDYSQVENLTYKVLNEFEKSNNKRFYFTEFSIFLITSFGDVEISMLDFYEYINIFNLVTPKESLFEEGDMSENIYVFGEDYSAGMVFNGKISDYIYLTVYNYDKLSYEYEDIAEIPTSFKIYEENLDKIKTCLINYEKNLNNDKGAFYNVNLYYNDEENNIVFSCEKLEVEKLNFDKNIESIYQKAVRRNNIETELFFRFEDSEDIENYELTLKNGELVIKEYIVPEW